MSGEPLATEAAREAVRQQERVQSLTSAITHANRAQRDAAAAYHAARDGDLDTAALLLGIEKMLGEAAGRLQGACDTARERAEAAVLNAAGEAARRITTAREEGQA